jgi:hypothetical protein
LSRLLLDDYSRLRRRAESSDDDAGAGGATPISPRDDEFAAPRLERDRKDRSGRRGLTGVEFRRRRSV